MGQRRPGWQDTFLGPSGRPTGEWNLGAPIRRIRFSQDGTRFVAVSKGVARYFTAAGKALQRVSIGEGNLAFSADLRLVARSDGGLTVFEVGATRPVVSLKTLGWEGSRVQCLAISPDRRKVVLGGSSYNPAAPGLPDDSVAWEYDLVRGKLGKSETTGEFGTQWAAYAPDGRRALAGNRHPDSDTAGWLQLFPPVQGLPAFAGVVEEVQFSPDARLDGGMRKENVLWILRSGTRLASLGLGFPQAALANGFAVTGNSQGNCKSGNGPSCCEKTSVAAGVPAFGPNLAYLWLPGHGQCLSGGCGQRPVSALPTAGGPGHRP